MHSLSALGPRVCIIGPSCSGKSTLAHILAQKASLPVTHLDQLAHIPHTNWQRCADADFIKRHNSIIAQDLWIVEGNYSICMKQRLERATAVIWLDLPLWFCVYRYIMRSLKKDPSRVGALSGATQEFSLKLLKFTLINYPKNKQKYDALIQRAQIPLIRITSMKDLTALCAKL